MRNPAPLFAAASVIQKYLSQRRSDAEQTKNETVRGSCRRALAVRVFLRCVAASPRETLFMILGATVLLGACSLAPRYERPPLPTGAEYPGEYSGDVAAGSRPAELGWRDFFADPRLEALIAASLERNRDLAIAITQIEETRGLYRIQRADRLPTLTVGADGTRTRYGPDSVAAGGLSVADEPVTVDRYALSAGIASFELDFWGRVRNLSESARREYLATIEAARAVRLWLIRERALAYLSAREAAERIELAQATLESRRQELQIAQRRLDAGVTSALDYHQAETLLTQAETELAALRLTHAQAENALATLIGGPVAGSLPDALPLEQQVQVDTLAAGVPSELLATRPDVVAAEQQLRAARANIGAARAPFFPSITLTGAYGYSSEALDDLVGQGGLTWSYGPSITLPLFDFGRRSANLSVAEARDHIAVANYELTIQTAFQEVANALAGRRYLSEQVAAQERGTIAQRRLAAFARARYREGVVSHLEVLDAERNLFAAEQTLLQVRRAEAANLVTLYVALGGGALDAR